MEEEGKLSGTRRVKKENAEMRDILEHMTVLGLRIFVFLFGCSEHLCAFAFVLFI